MPESVAEDVRSKINEHVKAVEEKTSSQQQTALQVRPAQPSLCLLLLRRACCHILAYCRCMNSCKLYSFTAAAVLQEAIVACWKTLAPVPFLT